MGYSKFKKIRDVIKKFNLDMKLERLIPLNQTTDPSAWLLQTLSMAQRLPLTNEKSKAERVISPILTEVANVYSDRVSFFSGEAININAKDNLAGECDFFFVSSAKTLY